MACFYLQIPVGHVEAGLRTYDIYSPFPEEFNREAVSIISNYNFVPTSLSRDNLIREGRKEETIYLTGNTVIDAMRYTVRTDYIGVKTLVNQCIICLEQLEECLLKTLIAKQYIRFI